MAFGGLYRPGQQCGTRAQAFAHTSRYAGLPQPKGVLLVGVPRLRQEPLSACARRFVGRATSSSGCRAHLRVARGCLRSQHPPRHSNGRSREPVHPVDRRGREGLRWRGRTGWRWRHRACVRRVSELVAGQARRRSEKREGKKKREARSEKGTRSIRRAARMASSRRSSARRRNSWRTDHDSRHHRRRSPSDTRGHCR